MTCVFCSIADGTDTEHSIIWSDETHVAFLDRYPVAEGHVLVIPRAHIDYVFDMEHDAYLALMEAVKKVAGPLQSAMRKERIVTVLEGFSVPHVHAHLVPNSNDDDRVRFVKPSVPEFDLPAIAERLRPLYL